jgi:hypothetical protein
MPAIFWENVPWRSKIIEKHISSPFLVRGMVGEFASKNPKTGVCETFRSGGALKP